jgi:4-aminobutyrate aminotransferase/(S)-3-amino-2-methylpropionate transaminase
MIGVELEAPELAARATRRLLEAGFLSLTGGTRGEVITWTPALTIDEALLRAASTALRDALAAG